MDMRTRFQSKWEEYETPNCLFNELHSEFHFTLDVCASDANHKVANYYTKKDNALSKKWLGVCWMNPPRKRPKEWVTKAYNEAIDNNSIVVCLVPVRTDTIWWHRYCMRGEIRYIQGRIKFNGCKYGLPQPLAVVIFGNGYFNEHKTVNYAYSSTCQTVTTY